MSIKKKPSQKEKPVRQTQGKLVGRVSHYFGNIGVVAIKLSAPLSKGDVIRIEGGGTSFEQKVESLQKEHEKIEKGKKGDEVGLKVKKKAREGYRAYKK